MCKGRQHSPGLPVTRLHFDPPVDRWRGSKIHLPGSVRGFASARQSLASSKPVSLKRLTYSAGAAVTFSLTDLKRRRIVLADALFHASDEFRFAAAATTVTPSIVIGTQKSDPGLVSLPLRTPAPPSPDVV
ncbi:hypothetical protein LPLAFNJD_LOCUS2341 [Methylorubrum aminovorans]